MKIKTTIALTCLLLAGCEAKVKVETKTSEPFTTNEVVVGVGPDWLTTSVKSPDHWMAATSIYRCDDGGFELAIHGTKIDWFATLEEARSARTNRANLVAEFYSWSPPKACGVKVE